jgi:NadR type nicotinamide-nucleotide adenylyltransferase
MNSIKKIAITGPESTGKSTLARQLAIHYKTVWVPEYARTYIEKLDRLYYKDDLLAILKGQIKSEEELMCKADKFLFCDTDLTVIKIWAEHKYGSVDPCILSEFAHRSYDLYLLLDIDLSWQFDPQREHPDKRKFFFDWFERELKHKKAHYHIISGNNDDRFKNACSIIDALLNI